MINRKEILQEQKIREVIRRLLTIREQKTLIKEQELRNAIRKRLIMEGEKEKNYPNTGLNNLAIAFRDSKTGIEDGYKKLQTSEIQRRSFIVHMVSTFESMLNSLRLKSIASTDSIDGSGDGGTDESGVTTETLSDEKISINTPNEDIDQDNLVANEDKPQKKEGANVKDFIKQIFSKVPADTENIEHWQTGADVAEETWNQIGHNFIDNYPIAKEDIAMYEKYLLPNLKAYFKKFEADIVSPSTTNVGKEIDSTADGTADKTSFGTLPPSGEPAANPLTPDKEQPISEEMPIHSLEETQEENLDDIDDFLDELFNQTDYEL